MQYKPLDIQTIQTSAAVKERRFISYAGSHCGAGVHCRGVSLYDRASGKNLDLVQRGTALVEAGAAFSKGVKIASDATGRAVASSGRAELNGYSLKAATEAGQIIEIDLWR